LDGSWDTSVVEMKKTKDELTKEDAKEKDVIKPFGKGTPCCNSSGLQIWVYRSAINPIMNNE
jgi:hypothetical protein